MAKLGSDKFRKTKAAPLLAVIVGVGLSFAVLFGPSLVGKAIPLPLNLLALGSTYLDSPSAAGGVRGADEMLFDQISADEVYRPFVAGEFRAGRFALWNPFNLLGVPFVSWAKYSPYQILLCVFPAPVALVWVKLLKAIVAALGAYFFFRLVLEVEVLPAVLGAWCYPFTAFFIFWGGLRASDALSWFPWLLLALERTVNQPRGKAPLALALVTALVLISGQLDVSGLILIAAGLYLVWRVVSGYREARDFVAFKSALGVSGVGLTLGFFLSAPYLLPLLEYSRLGHRIQARAEQTEERPPVGLEAALTVVLPRADGPTHDGMAYLGRLNILESSSTAYAGLLALFFAAPLAWCQRRHRGLVKFWSSLGLGSLAWQLGVPGLVQVMRLPGLNLFSFNRFGFVAGFSTLLLAVLGLDALATGKARWQKEFGIACAALIALLGWCLFRAFSPPEPLATVIENAFREGKTVRKIADLASLFRIKEGFRNYYLMSAGLCALGLGAWAGFKRMKNGVPWLVGVVGVLLLAELLWQGFGFQPQNDPSLYYPNIPTLQKLSEAPEGRSLCVGCLPANLNVRFGLKDIRGYDAIDYAPMVEFLEIARAAQDRGLPYSAVQIYVPRLKSDSANGLVVPATLNLLNLRYLVFRGTPPLQITPYLQGDDYWVVENPKALSRVFLPQRAIAVPDPGSVLRSLSAESFDPVSTAYVQTALDLPAQGRGEVRIEHSTPDRVVIEARMEAPALVVLSDLWYPGWKADWNGQPLEILRTDHVLRGVQVPQGIGTLTFRYDPASFAWGCRFFFLAVATLVLWSVWLIVGQDTLTVPVRGSPLLADT